MAHARIYLLDPYGEPVPIGAPGEIYIGGSSVARGYINSPDLTGERFVPNAFSAAPGARFYCIGDRARRLPDGSIEFLGRMDQQFNLGDVRVEPSEIEVLLRQHAGVSESAVVLVGESNHERLAAFIVSDGSKAPSIDELRAYLSRRLSSHMLPAHIVAVSRFPRLPNGKIDYNALPSPEHIRIDA